MYVYQSIIGLVLCTSLLSMVFCEDNIKVTKKTVEEPKSDRKGKFFSVFQVVTFANDGCSASSSRNGTCYTAAECTAKGGVASGTCASGYGVCCLFSLSCGARISENCTYLVQPSTTTAPKTDPCTYTICKCSTNICRIRLDFTTFNIAQPQVGTVTQGNALITNGGGIGDCLTDTFSVTSPGSAGSPVICGFNTGQHMLLDASDACNIASFDLGAATGITREWDIKVTQYECGNDAAGPDGCLQYFTGTTGRVSSFNFPTTATTIPATATHLSSQCYTMCFRQEDGMCSICYWLAVPAASGNPAIQASFGLSITANAMVQSEADGGCLSDYIVIPGATITANTPNTQTERMCGRIFDPQANPMTTSTTVCTNARPFKIEFKTDANEVATAAASPMTNEQSMAPGGIVGFSLIYKQVACP